MFGRWFLSLTRESKKAPHFRWKKIPQAKKKCSDLAKAKTRKKVFLKKRPDPRWAVYLKSSKKGGPKTVQETVSKIRVFQVFWENNKSKSRMSDVFRFDFLSKLNWVLQSLTKIKVLQKVCFFLRSCWLCLDRQTRMTVRIWEKQRFTTFIIVSVWIVSLSSFRGWKSDYNFIEFRRKNLLISRKSIPNLTFFEILELRQPSWIQTIME